MKEFTLKDELIKYVKDNQKYMMLKNIEQDEDIDKLIEELKAEYIAICARPNIGATEDLQMITEYQRHAQKSEILGKIIMLVHEFQGFKGVQEVLNEIHWKQQDIIVSQIEKLEDELAKYQKNNDNKEGKYE